MKKIYRLIFSGIISSGLITAGIGLASSNDATQKFPNAKRGKVLSERLCVNCHVVSEDVGGAVPEGVPPFKVIANKAGQTAEHIRNILVQPHAPMPNMNLSRLEIDDIIAYLDELRLKNSGAPLLPEKQEKSVTPEFPEPA